jgi:hypothetical protein
MCGEPVPEGETMFKFHGFSGPCPAPPLPRPAVINWQTSYERALARLATLDAELESAKRDAELLRDAANRIEGDDVLARLRSGNATPEDQYNVANSLAYLWAQDGLLSEAQQEVGQLRDQLAEVERPLDKQMARLNANLLAANRARMDAERELDAARADAERADAERFAYWFGNKPKPLSLVDDYLEGIRERWSLDLWRAAIDAARKERT